MIQPTLIAAFIGGIISFLSPCVLPLLPGFLAYLAGTTINEENPKKKIIFHTIAYVLGFSIVFSLLGVLLNTVLQSVSYNIQKYLSYIAGVIIISFGLYLVGLLKLSFLNAEHTFHIKRKTGYLTSFIFGASFAVGWTPCVGAVLGSILSLAIANPTMSFALLLSYSFGLGIPFLLLGIFSSHAVQWIKKISPILKYFNILVGILLILLGIFVFTQTLSLIANFSLLNSFLLR